MLEDGDDALTEDSTCDRAILASFWPGDMATAPEFMFLGRPTDSFADIEPVS